MCGRTAMPLGHEDVRSNVSDALSEADLSPERWIDEEAYRPSHNVAPTYFQPVVRMDRETNEPVIHSMKWGLIPFWTKRQPDFATMLKTINCRDDSLFEGRGMWNALKGKNRCVVVARGFYEWLKKGKDKQPYFTSRKDGKLMCFAALYDSVKYEDAEKKLWTYTIITTSSNKQLSFLHDRMPVILDPKDVPLWLDPNEGWGDKVSKLLQPFKHELQCFPVSKEVGKVGNDSPDFMVAVNSSENKSNIANFFNNAKAKQDATPAKRKAEHDETERASKTIKTEQESTPAKSETAKTALKDDKSAANQEPIDTQTKADSVKTLTEPISKHAAQKTPQKSPIKTPQKTPQKTPSKGTRSSAKAAISPEANSPDKKITNFFTANPA